MDNAFLEANMGKIGRLKTYLLEIEMMGNPDLPCAEIRHLFDGLVLEISKLQGENKELIKLVKEQQVKPKEGVPSEQAKVEKGVRK